MTAIIYPNGTTLTSTALSPDAINRVVQALTCSMLGLSLDFSKVRINWQTQGQPFDISPGDDVCYLACTVHDVEYSRIRDQAMSMLDGVLVSTWLYTRGWLVKWCFYGANATDHARAVHSGLFMDWVNYSLNASNLFPVNDTPEPTRIPELINAQWWERADFHVIMYEQVTETISEDKALSVEIKVEDSNGLEADITVQ